MTLDEFKKLPSRTPGIPAVIWGATGKTRGCGIKSGSELREKLADGMSEKEIDKLSETRCGCAVMDEYVDDRERRCKEVERATDGVFDSESPSGNMEKTYIADHHTGEILPDKTNA